MAKNNFQIVVFTKRKLLENRIKNSVPPYKTSCLYIAELKKLIAFCGSSDRRTLIITEQIKELTVNSLSKLTEKNNNLEILIIIPEYGARMINKIIKHEKLDFIIEDASFTEMLKRKITRLLSGNSSLRVKKKSGIEFKSKYFSLLDNMFIGLYRTTPEGKILMLNKAALKMIGCKSVREVQRVNLEDEYYDPYKLRNLFKRQLMEHGEVTDFENRWRLPNGKLIIVRENAKAFKNKSGKILYYEGTFEDITARVQIEKALFESEKKLHLTLEAANIGIWNWNIKTNEIFCSREFSTMLGFKPDELMPTVDSFINHIYTEDRQIFLKSLIANVTEVQPDFETEIRMVNKSGELRWMLIKGKVVEWSGQIPMQLIAVQIDLTDRKLAETRIIESETRFRELAENIEEIFWLLSEKNILYISPGLEKIWGVSPSNKEKLTKTLYRTVRIEDRARIKKAIKKMKSIKGRVFLMKNSVLSALTEKNAGYGHALFL